MNAAPLDAMFVSAPMHSYFTATDEQSKKAPVFILIAGEHPDTMDRIYKGRSAVLAPTGGCAAPFTTAALMLRCLRWALQCDTRRLGLCAAQEVLR